MALFPKRIRTSQPRLPIDPDLASPRGKSAAHTGPFIDLLLVGAGGALGTLARYACTQTWSDRSGRFPLTIFLVNVSGGLLIGVLLTWLARVGKMGAARLFCSVGILGGWTTMSTFAIGVDQLVAHHHGSTAALYAASTLCSGAVATALGISIGANVPRAATR